jgi:predicted permease
VVAALGTAAASALAPALRVTAALSRVLGEGGRGAVGGALARLGGALVTLEVALSAVLLIGALAMVQLVQELATFDLGVRTERVLTARLGLFESAYPDAEARLRLFERLTEALRAEPDVEDATITTTIPGLMGPNEDLLPAAAAPNETPFEVGFAAIDPRFGGTWGTRLLEGRWIDTRDHAGAERVAVVDTKFVERHAEGRPVIGQRFRVSPGESGDRVVTVVGVVEALTLEDADDPPEGVVLVPLAQDTPAFASLALRVRGDPAAFKPRLAEVMRGIDPDTPLYWVRTWDEVEVIANFGQHLLARIYAVLGLIGLLLAVGGLYGVVGAQVAERTREIGVRRALGATPRGVLATVLRRSAGYTGVGLALGLALGVPFALALSRSLQGTMAVDPMIWLLVTLLLGATAAVASLIPARRALRVDPMVALRHD